jgi:short-subunit dehydrogenase
LITPVKLDVTSDLDVEAVTAKGPFDILINNAGLAVYGGVLKGQIDAIRSEIEVNYFGVLRMARTVAPAMIERGDGLIVNIASILGKVSVPAIGTYAATKAALLSLTQSLRGDLAPHGVRVIAVLPSTTDTDMSRDFSGPKLAPDDVAREILEAIKSEQPETPIGDTSRQVLAALKTDALEVERSFAKYRA